MNPVIASAVWPFGRLADRRFGQSHTKNGVSQSIFKILKKYKLLLIDKINTYNKYFIS